MLKLAKAKGIRSQGRDMYSVNFADYLPETLKRDPKMKALAAAVAEQMLGVSAEIDNVLIYSRIDELPEELIDILAFDMHVDWYDYSYTLDVKRSILKNSVKVHKKMGTKYAVETAMRNVYKHAGISEWFEYGGKPYHFKIDVDISREGMTENTGSEIAEKVNFYKNLRSHCDGIYYHLKMDPANVSAAACTCIGTTLKVKAELADSIRSKEKLRLLSRQKIGERIKVKAYLPEHLAGVATERAIVLAGTILTEDIKVKAHLEESVQGQAAGLTMPAGVMSVDRIKIKAEPEKELKAGFEIKEFGYQRMENRLMVRKGQ